MATSRRQFLNRILNTGVAAITAYVVYPVIRFLIPPPVALDEQSRVVVASVGELKPNSAKFFRFLDKPAVLVRLQSGEYEALSAKCTHLGCTVDFDRTKDFFFCNCHGSQFDINGKVLKGPATKPLPQYLVSVADNNIYVSVRSDVA